MFIFLDLLHSVSQDQINQEYVSLDGSFSSSCLMSSCVASSIEILHHNMRLIFSSFVRFWQEPSDYTPESRVETHEQCERTRRREQHDTECVVHVLYIISRKIALKLTRLVHLLSICYYMYSNCFSVRSRRNSSGVCSTTPGNL